MGATRIGFVGTDGRTLLAALETARALSELYPGNYQGVVVRGTGAMPAFARKMNWPVDFISVPDNSAEAYGGALIEAFKQKRLDLALVMPEALIFEGLVDKVSVAGYGDRVIGLNKQGAFIEGDKLECKRLCREAGIPVAPAWMEADARVYRGVLAASLAYIHGYGGAVLKYPYSAGG